MQQRELALVQELAQARAEQAQARALVQELGRAEQARAQERAQALAEQVRARELARERERAWERAQALAERAELARERVRARERAERAERARELAERARERAEQAQARAEQAAVLLDNAGEELARANARVQELEQALEQARVQELEHLRAWAEQAVVGQEQWRQFGQRLAGLARTIASSFAFATSVVHTGVAVLPSAHRVRYKDEWDAELEQLKVDQQPLLGVAFRILLRAPWLAVVLWTKDLVRLAVMRRLGRAESLWKGAMSASAVFTAAAAGMWTGNGSPTGRQVVLALAASGLTGLLTSWQETRNRRVRKHDQDP